VGWWERWVEVLEKTTLEKKRKKKRCSVLGRKIYFTEAKPRQKLRSGLVYRRTAWKMRCPNSQTKWCKDGEEEQL